MIEIPVAKTYLRRNAISLKTLAILIIIMLFIAPELSPTNSCPCRNKKPTRPNNRVGLVFRSRSGDPGTREPPGLEPEYQSRPCHHYPGAAIKPGNTAKGEIRIGPARIKLAHIPKM